MDNKLVSSIEDAIRACGLRDGMTVDFNHHLRNGDRVVPMVMQTIARMGYKDIKITASAIMEGMMENGLGDVIDQGVVRSVEITGNSKLVGEKISHCKFREPCRFQTHGGRPRSIISGEVHIDVCFIAAPTADPMGNCNGCQGPSAFGAMGMSMTSARYADKVVVITDNLVPYPLPRVSVDESLVDYVVKVDSIGDPAGIATGITKPTKDPIQLLLAEYTASIIEHSGLLVDGFSYQAGGGGSSIATTNYVTEAMIKKGIHGSYLLGGINNASLNMIRKGLFDTVLDTQSFDRFAAKSLFEDPWHREISDANYACPGGVGGNRSCAVDNLDVVVLGGLEVDLNFNVNLIVNSAGMVSGGAGGHSDTAAGAKCAIVVAPLRRTRFPTIVKECTSITTPGKDINAVVTEYGVAVNPNSPQLRQNLIDNGVKVVNIEDLQRMVEDMTGVPRKPRYGDRLVAEVVSRNGEIIDRIYNIID